MSPSANVAHVDITPSNVHHKPRLLSDNGPSYIAGELADYIQANLMSHGRGAPMHPQSQARSNAGTRP